MVPVKVSGPVSFLLLAVWTLPVESNGSYVQPLFEALALYKNLFVDTPVVWAGDFNSNFLFDRPNRKYKFRDFVSELEKLDIKSLYHCQSGCRFGEETEKLSLCITARKSPITLTTFFLVVDSGVWAST